MEIEEIKHILYEQRRDMEELFSSRRIVERELKRKVSADIRSRVAKIITGARRSGKS